MLYMHRPTPTFYDTDLQRDYDKTSSNLRALLVGAPFTALLYDTRATFFYLALVTYPRLPSTLPSINYDLN